MAWIGVILFLSITVMCQSGLANTCCVFVNTADDLIHCILPNLYQDGDVVSDVAIAVYASRDIWNYTAYSLLVNDFYAKSRGYTLKFYGVEPSSDFYPKDKKWNKIGTVLDSLHPSLGWARTAKYFVAIDADLIVSDFALHIDAMARSHPKAHIIMSRDAVDVANSGFMIVRNSKWAYEFVKVINFVLFLLL